MPSPPAAELLAPTTGTRTFVAERRVRLGDVDPAGRLRLDGVARYLQDVATDDADDAGLDPRRGWVVRRTLIRVTRPARLGEHLTLTTFCTGTGRSWAERRTSIGGGAGAVVEAVSLWVQVDAASGRPAALADDFLSVYGPASAGRRVSARLALPGVAPHTTSYPWRTRRTDLDPFAHVNNAAYWSALEEVLGDADRRGVGEIEYLVPVEPDTVVGLASAVSAGVIDVWMRDAAGGVRAAMRWTPTVASPAPGDVRS